MASTWIVIILAAVAASTLAAVAGTGGGIILLPLLVSVFGVRDAVPMYAIVQFAGNVCRVVVNRASIDFVVVRWFALGAIPCAVMGAWLFSRMPDTGLMKLLGVFLIVSALARRGSSWLQSGFNPRWFASIGGLFALISAIVGSAGPFLAPFYLCYGLTRSGFIGTEALGTAFMHVAKLASYQSLGTINPGLWSKGLILSPAMLMGTLLGKRLIDRIPAQTFVQMMDVLVLCFGLWFVFK